MEVTMHGVAGSAVSSATVSHFGTLIFFSVEAVASSSLWWLLRRFSLHRVTTPRLSWSRNICGPVRACSTSVQLSFRPLLIERTPLLLPYPQNLLLVAVASVAATAQPEPRAGRAQRSRRGDESEDTWGRASCRSVAYKYSRLPSLPSQRMNSSRP